MIPRACPACRFINLEGLSVCMSCDQPLGTSKAEVESILAAQRARRKAARRAEVRQRVRDSEPQRLPAGAGANGLQPTVLLLQPDARVRAELARVLESFGFSVSAPAVDEHSLRPPGRSDAAPAVVIIDVRVRSMAGDDVIDLCQAWKETFDRDGHATTAWLITAERVRPKDRIRAILAGRAEVVVGELSRGVVASALERLGVALPMDPRTTR